MSSMPPLSPYICPYCKIANPGHKSLECPKHPNPKKARETLLTEARAKVERLKGELTDAVTALVLLEGLRPREESKKRKPKKANQRG